MKVKELSSAMYKSIGSASSVNPYSSNYDGGDHDGGGSSREGSSSPEYAPSSSSSSLSSVSPPPPPRRSLRRTTKENSRASTAAAIAASAQAARDREAREKKAAGNQRKLVMASRILFPFLFIDKKSSKAARNSIGNTSSSSSSSSISASGTPSTTSASTSSTSAPTTLASTTTMGARTTPTTTPSWPGMGPQRPLTSSSIGSGGSLSSRYNTSSSSSSSSVPPRPRPVAPLPPIIRNTSTQSCIPMRQAPSATPPASSARSSSYGNGNMATIGYNYQYDDRSSNLMYPTFPDVKLKKLPFFKILATLMQPCSLQPSGTARFQEQKFSFYLSPSQAGEIANSSYRDTNHRPEYKKQIQMRFSLLETSCEQDDNFPSSICVKVIHCNDSCLFDQKDWSLESGLNYVKGN